MVVLLAVTLTIAAFTALPAPEASAQSTVNVAIRNYAFTPNTITVVIGMNNTVTWTNYDSVIHTVTADDNSWGSGNLASGDNYTYTFQSAGTFGYHCTIHTYMTAKVVVLAPGSPTSSSTTTSTTTSSASSSSSTASSASSGGVPEFPFEGALVALVTLGLVASYFVIRRSSRGQFRLPA